MKNQDGTFLMVLEWARRGSQCLRDVAFGFAMGAAGGRLEPWQSQYVKNVVNAQDRGVSA